MTVRNAIPEDIETIALFQQKMARETEGIDLESPVVIRGVQSVFEDPSKGFYIVARQDEKVIASMLLTPEWSDWRNRLFLWIQSLYVVPEFRKKGVFTMMYNHIKKMVRQSDAYAGIKLYVDRDNLRAQEVYKRVGMISSHYNLFEWNKDQL